ncbi:uncharacterized protein LOC121400990 [Xenopus laevis]|uniref:Uncharacterized protein LOC121400990 n=1 Tax=Xenopus laevis TaxID=8355 RepID=A0A8J1MJU4_XENLA|nr:uncharacterized protein LOC121400990 [Xenopus laevis]
MEEITIKTSLLTLYVVLEDFREEDTDFKALASYYEHHYRVHYGKNVVLEDFILRYFSDPRTTHRDNIYEYWVLIHYLEVLERECVALYSEELLPPEASSERWRWGQHFEYLRLQNTIQWHLHQLAMTLWEREQKLQEAAGYVFCTKHFQLHLLPLYNNDNNDIYFPSNLVRNKSQVLQLRERRKKFLRWRKRRKRELLDNIKLLRRRRRREKREPLGNNQLLHQRRRKKRELQKNNKLLQQREKRERLEKSKLLMLRRTRERREPLENNQLLQRRRRRRETRVPLGNNQLLQQR